MILCAIIHDYHQKQIHKAKCLSILKFCCHKRLRKLHNNCFYNPPMGENSSINRYFLEIQNCFEVLKFLNFQKPLNLRMKICNGHIFFEKITSSKFRFRRIRTNFKEYELLSPIG